MEEVTRVYFNTVVKIPITSLHHTCLFVPLFIYLSLYLSTYRHITSIKTTIAIPISTQTDTHTHTSTSVYLIYLLANRHAHTYTSTFIYLIYLLTNIHQQQLQQKTHTRANTQSQTLTRHALHIHANTHTQKG